MWCQQGRERSWAGQEPGTFHQDINDIPLIEAELVHVLPDVLIERPAPRPLRLGLGFGAPGRGWPLAHAAPALHPEGTRGWGPHHTRRDEQLPPAPPAAPHPWDALCLQVDSPSAGTGGTGAG